MKLERKRHIGNDIVVILFQEGDTEYKPTTISSRQVHVVIVVKKIKLEEDPQNTYYRFTVLWLGTENIRMSLVARDEVPEFDPPIEPNCVFKKSEEFRTFFYTKCS